MNRNPKEKDARIEVRTSPGKKKKIQHIANKCNLSLSEYIVQRALGYEPKTVLPDAFYTVWQKLCDIANQAEVNGLEKTQALLKELIEYTHYRLIESPQKSVKEILEEMKEWQQQDSGQ